MKKRKSNCFCHLWQPYTATNSHENTLEFPKSLNQIIEWWQTEALQCGFIYEWWCLCSYPPGYFPPLFLWMKQMMRRIRMSRAMAHMRPMNHPWVAMSTCLLATAGQRRRGRLNIHDWTIFLPLGRGNTNIHAQSCAQRNVFVVLLASICLRIQMTSAYCHRRGQLSC